MGQTALIHMASRCVMCADVNLSPSWGPSAEEGSSASGPDIPHRDICLFVCLREKVHVGISFSCC